MAFVGFAVGHSKQFVNVHFSGVYGVLRKCGEFQGIWSKLGVNQEGNGKTDAKHGRYLVQLAQYLGVLLNLPQKPPNLDL